MTLTTHDARLLEVARTLSDLEREVLIQKLQDLHNKENKRATQDENGLVQALSRRAFREEEAVELELESLFRYFEQRRELLKGALTATDVGRLLGTARQTAHDRLAAGTLIAVLDKGAYRFPRWQFDAEGPDGVIDGLPEVWKCLSGSDFAKLNWLMRQNLYLDGLTPVEALKQGQKDKVIREAAATGVHEW